VLAEKAGARVQGLRSAHTSLSFIKEMEDHVAREED
jgi:hypothetical protein